MTTQTQILTLPKDVIIGHGIHKSFVAMLDRLIRVTEIGGK